MGDAWGGGWNIEVRAEWGGWTWWADIVWLGMGGVAGYAVTGGGTRQDGG